RRQPKTPRRTEQYRLRDGEAETRLTDHVVRGNIDLVLLAAASNGVRDSEHFITNPAQIFVFVILLLHHQHHNDDCYHLVYS
uniref:Uncharacterized protein n=1 Tax=Anopheles atroparvus TaxID=41427 RepID=A0AAG5D0R4_ANOAO